MCVKCDVEYIVVGRSPIIMNQRVVRAQQVTRGLPGTLGIEKPEILTDMKGASLATSDREPRTVRVHSLGLDYRGDELIIQKYDLRKDAL